MKQGTSGGGDLDGGGGDKMVIRAVFEKNFPRLVRHQNAPVAQGFDKLDAPFLGKNRKGGEKEKERQKQTHRNLRLVGADTQHTARGITNHLFRHTPHQKMAQPRAAKL